MNAIEEIAAERKRQIEVEGWTAEHDDFHDDDELAVAAGCYAFPNRRMGFRLKIPVDWPWHPSWWKPTTRRRDLIKAGALIVAEIERLDRLAEKEKGK